MRKIHLRYVLDEDLNVSITLCGLAETPKRPMTDIEADVTCSRCKEELAATKQEEEAEKPRKKKEKNESAPKPPTDAPVEKLRKPRKKKKGNENEEAKEGEVQS